MAESRSLRFAATARALGEVARGHGYTVPSFRSPPRRPGRLRTIRRNENGSATVSVVVRERPWFAVVADIIDGFVAANADAPDVVELRDRLWHAVEDIDVSSGDRAGPQDASVTQLHPAA